MRRTRLTDRRQLKLWPDWRHFAFLTDLDGDAVTVDRFHREHATVELVSPNAAQAGVPDRRLDDAPYARRRPSAASRERDRSTRVVALADRSGATECRRLRTARAS